MRRRRRGGQDRRLIDVAARLATPARRTTTTPILDAYLLMLSDPLLHERSSSGRSATSGRAPSGRWRARARRSASSSARRARREGLVHPRAPARHQVRRATGCCAPSRATRSVSIPRLDAADHHRRARPLARRHGGHGARARDRLRDRGRYAHEPHVDHGARARDPGRRRRRGRALATSARATCVIVDGLRGEITVRPSERLRSRDARGASRAPPRVRARAPLGARPPVRHGVTACPSASARTSSSPPRRSSRSITAPTASASTAPSSSTSTALTQPDEHEQYELYRAVIEAVAPRPVVAAHVRHRRRQVRQHVPAPRRDEPGARPARRAARARASPTCSSRSSARWSARARTATCGS